SSTPLNAAIQRTCLVFIFCPLLLYFIAYKHFLKGRDSVMALLLEARRPFNFAHILTSVRLVLTPLFLFAIAAAEQQPNAVRATLVAGLFALICARDYYDGPLARALRLDSDLGKVLDRLADIILVFVTLTYLVQRGAVTVSIPTARGL